MTTDDEAVTSPMLHSAGPVAPLPLNAVFDRCGAQWSIDLHQIHTSEISKSAVGTGLLTLVAAVHRDCRP